METKIGKMDKTDYMVIAGLSAVAIVSIVMVAKQIKKNKASQLAIRDALKTKKTSTYPSGMNIPDNGLYASGSDDIRDMDNLNCIGCDGSKGCSVCSQKNASGVYKMN